MWLSILLCFANIHFPIFDVMKPEIDTAVVVESITVKSAYLKREVLIDYYVPAKMNEQEALSLLLINDGQDLPNMPFEKILNDLYSADAIAPLLAVGIHCSADRKMEYGVATEADYLGRGAKAGAYTNFILKELLPQIKKKFGHKTFKDISYAGFSLGGLGALDIVWNHPETFKRAGIFSGSLWWRSVAAEDTTYDDDKHRIMQQHIRKGAYKPGMKFFFQCGLLDEKADRNNNGIIDAIDDTRDHVQELFKKGYTLEDITYMELDDGKHDVPTWAKSFPAFLIWGWGK